MGMRTSEERRFAGCPDDSEILEGPNGRSPGVCRTHVTSTQPIIFRRVAVTAPVRFVTYTSGVVVSPDPDPQA